MGKLDQPIYDLTWPDNLETATRILMNLLAETSKSGIEIASSLEVFRSTPEAIEAMAMVKLEGEKEVARVIAAGSSPDEAVTHAAYFAARKALVGEQAVCGVLLNRLGTRVVLVPTDRADEYQLQITCDRLNFPRRYRTGRALGASNNTYKLRVRLEPQGQGRTRYLSVTGIHCFPELQEYLRPRLRFDRVRLHRLILALDGIDMSDGKLHAHHINGIGYDCRRDNLQPTTAHSRYHRRFAPSLSDLEETDPSIMSSDLLEDIELSQSTWEHQKYLPGFAPFRRRHNWREGDYSRSSKLVFLPAKRRDRRRSLDRAVIKLMQLGGEAAMLDLVDALSDAPTRSYSGVRKVVSDLAKRRIIKRFKQGRAEYVHLVVPIPKVFRIKRILDRSAHLRRIRHEAEIMNRSPWWRSATGLAISRRLRRVMVPSRW